MSEDWKALDFNGVVGTLQGWLNRVVRVSVETGQPDRPLSLAHAAGVLRASGALFAPQGYDLDEYPFELHPAGDHLSGFTLDRSCLPRSCHNSRGRTLIVTIGAPQGEPAIVPQLYIGVRS